VDLDQSGSIDVNELKRALVNSNWSRRHIYHLWKVKLTYVIPEFDLDTIKMLMNIFVRRLSCSGVLILTASDRIRIGAGQSGSMNSSVSTNISKIGKGVYSVIFAVTFSCFTVSFDTGTQIRAARLKNENWPEL
jgi:hypothetical protein